jgi:hypothetical protein
MGQRGKAVRAVRARGLSAAIALAGALLPGAALSSPPASIEQDMVVVQGASGARPLATETLRGIVASVDQASNTLKIRLSADTTEIFRVQDGLIFDAVRYGDHVEITVQDIAGSRTIVGLSRD